MAARLVEECIALLPKDPPPGPLNTCPLTVLSRAYRPLAGLRLADAIARHQAWVHLPALGFRPACSVVDGAAVT